MNTSEFWLFPDFDDESIEVTYLPIFIARVARGKLKKYQANLWLLYKIVKLGCLVPINLLCKPSKSTNTSKEISNLYTMEVCEFQTKQYLIQKVMHSCKFL